MIKSRLYYNPAYQGCGDQSTYLIYIANGKMYLTCPTDTYQVLEAPTFELNDDNIDDYAASRGFIKALERHDCGDILYFNDFGRPEKREDISKNMRRIREYIGDNVKFSKNNAAGVFIAFCEVNNLESRVW